MTGRNDWSRRYLGLAVLSVVCTGATWALNSRFVIHVALLTALAFGALALAHALQPDDSAVRY